MDTASFNAHFDEIVSPAVTDRGGVQRGRRLFAEVGPWSVALFRTNSLNLPPPAFTLCIRHALMRDFDDAVGGPPPTNANEYPLKMEPRDVGALFGPSWRYQPMNLGRYPRQEIAHVVSDDDAIDALWSLRRSLDDALSLLADEFPPTRLLCELERNGEDAWCERRWIEDLRQLFPSHVCARPRRAEHRWLPWRRRPPAHG